MATKYDNLTPAQIESRVKDLMETSAKGDNSQTEAAILLAVGYAKGADGFTGDVAAIAQRAYAYRDKSGDEASRRSQAAKLGRAMSVVALWPGAKETALVAVTNAAAATNNHYNNFLDLLSKIKAAHKKDKPPKPEAITADALTALAAKANDPADKTKPTNRDKANAIIADMAKLVEEIGDVNGAMPLAAAYKMVSEWAPKLGPTAKEIDAAKTKAGTSGEESVMARALAALAPAANTNTPRKRRAAAA
jgi:hypothetical protein